MLSPGSALAAPNRGRPRRFTCGVGDPVRNKASVSVRREGVFIAGVPRAPVASPNRAPISSRRTPHVSG